MIREKVAKARYSGGGCGYLVLQSSELPEQLSDLVALSGAVVPVHGQ